MRLVRLVCLLGTHPASPSQPICPALSLSARPQSDYISFRHHTYEMPRGAKSVELKECGPRFELRLYQIKLGTLDQPHAENEYVLRAYINSAKRARLAEAAAPEES